MTYAPLKRLEKTATISASSDAKRRPSITRRVLGERQPIFGDLPENHMLGTIQAKLMVGATNDPLEHEADTFAESVVAKMPSDSAPGAASSCSATSSGGELVQLKCDACSQEEEPVKVQRRARDSASVADSVGSSGIEAQLSRMRSGGHSMEPGLRSSMEHGFGADFSRVKLHADDGAADLAQRLNARAFTAGSDVFFNRGELRPAERAGQKLIAHELAHVLQQGGAETVRRKRNEGSAQEHQDEHIEKSEAISRIREYLNGLVFNEDEDAILRVLRKSRFSEVIRDRADRGDKDDDRLVYEKVLRRFHGKQRTELKQLHANSPTESGRSLGEVSISEAVGSLEKVDEPEAPLVDDEFTAEDARTYEDVEARDRARELLVDLPVAGFGVGRGNLWTVEYLDNIKAAFDSIPTAHHSVAAGFTVMLATPPASKGESPPAALWQHKEKRVWFDKNELNRFNRNVADEAKERNEKTNALNAVPGAEFEVIHELGHGVGFTMGTSEKPYPPKFYVDLPLSKAGLYSCMGKIKHKDMKGDRGDANMKHELFAEAYAAWAVNSHKLPIDMVQWFDREYGPPPVLGGRKRDWTKDGVDTKHFEFKTCK